MPVYNAERSVAAAIESVLRQSFADFELLLVDDGSTDSSRRVINGYCDPRIRLICQDANRGLAATLNAALHEAAGELVARHDADDISLPQRLELQVEALKTEPDLGAVGANLALMNEVRDLPGLWTYPYTPCFARWQVLFKTPVAHSVVMFRRAAVIGVGGYSEEFKHAEDYELWSRLLKVSDIKSLPVPLLKYRLGMSGVSRAHAVIQRATHLRIATRNISETLGTLVPERLVSILAIGLDGGERIGGLDQFISAASLCVELYETFLAKEGHRSDSTSVSADCRWRLMRLIRLLPYHRRLSAAGELRSIAPPGAVSAYHLLQSIVRP